jgi:hypothetical protein
MNWTPPKRSLINAVGYLEKKSVLTITLDNGQKFAYHEVQKKVYEHLLSAEDKDRYADLHVYPYYKMSEITGVEA